MKLFPLILLLLNFVNIDDISIQSHVILEARKLNCRILDVIIGKYVKD